VAHVPPRLAERLLTTGRRRDDRRAGRRGLARPAGGVMIAAPDDEVWRDRQAA
jgi:hypothetical protein